MYSDATKGNKCINSQSQTHQAQEMTVMKFVQLFILKKKLKETIMQESSGNINFSMFQSSSSNELLDLTCINCKEKYMELLEKLKIIQTYTPPPNVRITTEYSCG